MPWCCAEELAAAVPVNMAHDQAVCAWVLDERQRCRQPVLANEQILDLENRPDRQLSCTCCPLGHLSCTTS